MLLILAPSASSWSEKPKSTLELMFELPHRAELMFPCSIQMAPRHLWYASEWAWRPQPFVSLGVAASSALACALFQAQPASVNEE